MKINGLNNNRPQNIINIINNQINEIKVKAKETIDRAKEYIQKTMTALSKLFS